MKIRSILFYLSIMMVIYCILNIFFVPAIAIAINVFSNKNGAKTIITNSKIPQGSITINTDKIYRLDKNGKYYFEAIGIDQIIKNGGLVAIQVIFSAKDLTTSPFLFALSHPTAADKIIMDTEFITYNNFTRSTNNILKWCIATEFITVLKNNHLKKKLTTAETNNSSFDTIDYLGQDEESYGYMPLLSDSVTAAFSFFTNGTWLQLVEIYNNYYDYNSIKNMVGFTYHGYGTQIGLIRFINNNFLLGMYGGWQKLHGKLKNNNGEIDTCTWRLGPTIVWTHDGWDAEGLLIYNWNTIDSKVFQYKSDYTSNQWNIYCRGGYDFILDKINSDLIFTPEVQFLYLHQNRDEYNWALGMVGQSKTQGWTSRLGGSLTYDRLKWMQPITVQASFGWQYNDIKQDDINYLNQKIPNDVYEENSVYYSLNIWSNISEHLNINIHYFSNWSKNALSHYFQTGLKYVF